MASLIPDRLDAPGTHVLVIGVSAYRHFAGGSAPSERGKRFRMRQLSAAARSASGFAAWMLASYRNPAAPLASLRVLLSPAEGEQLDADIAARMPSNAGDGAATLANVKADLLAFRKACATHPDNVAIVYAAGHGVQLSKNGAIVLLHDCGDDAHLTELEGAIDMAGVHAGFNHPDTAQTQFWFVDACRQEPAMAERYETMEAGLTLDTLPGAARTNPVFLASSTQMAAFARVGGRTLFCEALLAGLQGGFAAPPDDLVASWHVSVSQLTTRLDQGVRALAKAESLEQPVDIGGRPTQALFHAFEQAPEAIVDVTVQPDGLAAQCVGTLSHRKLGKVLDANQQWPMHGVVRAGIYELSVDVGDPARNFFDYITVVPPAFTRKVAIE